jgi:hypothetical protein
MGAHPHTRWAAHEIAVLENRKAAKADPRSVASELGRTLQSVLYRWNIGRHRVRNARLRAAFGPPPPRADLDDYIRPPNYVLREREIRRAIPRTSITQVMFSDPVQGYSALDNKVRRISVQDALEICSLHNGEYGGQLALAKTYRVSPKIVREILDGSFFDRLLPRRRKEIE